MDLEEILQKEDELKTGIKKNCMLCMGRAHLASNRGSPEKESVLVGLDKIYKLYEDKFNQLRKEDAEVYDIKNSGDNKRFILDTLAVCKGCDREIDRVNRALNDLK